MRIGRRESTLLLDRTWSGDAWNQSLDETLGFSVDKLKSQSDQIRAKLVSAIDYTSISISTRHYHYSNSNPSNKHYIYTTRKMNIYFFNIQ